MNKVIPAVSIIIPMYNAERYIGACLDSILAQTFTDFEVIVVDDCSTDNSRAVVESYMQKFNVDKADKLQLLYSEKNSGAPGIPNNKGLSVSRGEYIYFLEADDMISETALEELYPIAKNFDADVIHCEQFYQFDDLNNCIISQVSDKPVEIPTLLTDDLDTRINYLYAMRFRYPVWVKLIRHSFITENKLQMIDANAHDANYTIALVLSAKRYVLVPNIVNFYRLVPNSLSHVKDNVQKTFHKWLNTLTKGFSYLDKFLSTHSDFKDRPDLKYNALDIWVRECCNYLQGFYAKIPANVLNEIVYHEFNEVEDKAALLAFMFSRMNIINVNFNQFLINLNR